MYQTPSIPQGVYPRQRSGQAAAAARPHLVPALPLLVPQLLLQPLELLLLELLLLQQGLLLCVWPRSSICRRRRAPGGRQLCDAMLAGGVGELLAGVLRAVEGVQALSRWRGLTHQNLG